MYLENIPPEFAPCDRVYRYKRSPFELWCTALRRLIDPYNTRFVRPSSAKIHLVPSRLLACVFANPRVTQMKPSAILSSGLKNEMALLCFRSPAQMPRFIAGDNYGGRLLLAGKTLLTL